MNSIAYVTSALQSFWKTIASLIFVYDDDDDDDDCILSLSLPLAS